MKLTFEAKRFREVLEAEAANYRVRLTAEALEGLAEYYELLSAWNSRLHLVAPSSPGSFAKRHVLESLLLLEYLPEGASVADIGSGAGLPIIPCLVARPDIQAVLIEASKKKAIFLREALLAVLDQTAISKRATVIAERFENIAAPEVGFITCRALERFETKLSQLLEWAPVRSKLLLFGGEGLGRRLEDSGVASTVTLIPNSERRFLFRVTKTE